MYDSHAIEYYRQIKYDIEFARRELDTKFEQLDLLLNSHIRLLQLKNNPNEFDWIKLNLSTQAYNCLNGCHGDYPITSIAEIEALSDKQLLKRRYLGPVLLREIRSAVASSKLPLDNHP